ncbi:FtsX-like permease family protein [Limibacter armeniacum]|uniref:ABC transporter permease n=1 Tax=Limibacter armeniacum TaxID=466084 RepID=UPI002FE5BD3A
MIKHSIQLVWARKKKNLLMVIEIAFSFLILFGLFTVLFERYSNYARERGFDTENVLILHVSENRTDYEKWKEERKDVYRSIENYLDANKDVEKFAYMDNTFPFSSNNNTEGSTFNYGLSFNYYRQLLSPKAIELLNLPFVQGRTFNETDYNADTKSMIINRVFYDHLKPYLNEKDELLDDDGQLNMKIVGVIENYKKKNEYEEQKFVGIWPYNKERFNQTLFFIKTKNDPTTIEAQLVSDLEKRCPDLAFGVNYFDTQRVQANKEVLLPLILLTAVCVFLIINVALGLYGVLWYNISKRKSEIGLRRAVGASKSLIRKQMLIEVGVLLLGGFLLGGLFVVQFPLLGVFNYTGEQYLIGTLLSAFFVGIITFICGYYPSVLASRITPVEALHEL